MRKKKVWKINKEGIELIKRFEGFSSAAYKCPADVWTIGYGFTEGVKQGNKITLENAEKRLKLELIKFEKCVIEHCKRDLNSNQFSALISFVFNVGCGAFEGSTMLKLLNDEKTPVEVIAKQFARWNKVGKTELTGLTKRREAEKELFLKKI